MDAGMRTWMNKRFGRWIGTLLVLILAIEAVAPGQTAVLPGAAPAKVQAETVTPVQAHGRLHVSGTDLVDAHGAKVQLKGVSTHGIAWFPQYVNKEAFRTLRDRYGINTIRLAMYATKGEGYGPAARKKVYEGVKYASELGMYVIIDFHILADGNPKHYTKKAAKFFKKVAKKYAQKSNVIYEICNEPNGNITWKKHVKPYAKKIIKVIRKYDKNGIIIVGTPTWSQDVDTAAADPIKGRKNIMYALHFYAATHKEWIREKLKTAHKKGLPVIVSEFSICDASGNGSLDKSSGNAWMKLLDEYNISYCAWSLCNKAESASLIASSCSKTGGWDWNDLSPAGKWYFAKTTGR